MSSVPYTSVNINRSPSVTDKFLQTRLLTQLSFEHLLLFFLNTRCKSILFKLFSLFSLYSNNVLFKRQVSAESIRRPRNQVVCHNKRWFYSREILQKCSAVCIFALECVALSRENVLALMDSEFYSLRADVVGR